jgi:hypothetical protein
MQRVMPSLSQNLRQTNHRLRFWLDRFVPKPAAPLPLATPEQMTAILSELLRAAEWLHTAQTAAREKDPDLDAEIREYRANVVWLHELLPGMHVRLLAERARLEVERSRVRATAEWARASRQTL